jgi:peptide chain release factor 1
VVHSDVIDKLHDNHGLAYSGTTEETDFASLGVRGQQVDHLDTSDKDLLGLTLLSEDGGRLVDRSKGLGLDGTLLIDGLTDNVKDTAESGGAYGNHDRVSSVLACLSTDKAFSGFHGNGTNSVLTEMLRDLKNEAGLTLGHIHFKSIKNRR